MGFEKRTLAVLLVIMMSFCGVCMGVVYKVGDSAGWTESGKVDYHAWSASKTFHVGDIIQFVYDNRFSNVVRVTHKGYNACSNLHAYAFYNSGNDSIPIRHPGHYYYITGLPGHCQTGQRVDIRVPENTSTSAPAPAPQSPSPPLVAPAPAPHSTSAPAPEPHSVPSPSVSVAPSGESPAPSPSTGNRVVSISGIWLAVVVAVAAAMLSGFGY